MSLLMLDWFQVPPGVHPVDGVPIPPDCIGTILATAKSAAVPTVVTNKSMACAAEYAAPCTNESPGKKLALQKVQYNPGPTPNPGRNLPREHSC